MVWFSYHGGHSGQFCRHAKGELEQVVEAAYAAGFTAYGLSEHAPRDDERYLYPEERDLNPAELARTFRRYVQRASSLRERFADRMEILVGFETEALPEPGWAEAMREIRGQAAFDYVVGSVHSVQEIWVDLNPDTTRRASDACGGREAMRCRYFATLESLVRELEPEVVGHVDLVRRFDGYDFELSAREMRAAEGVLEAALAVGALVEVNAAPERRGFGPVYPGPQVLALARRMGVPATLGDDSHGPDAVGVGLEHSLAALARAGYDRVHYLTRRDGVVVAESAAFSAVAPERR